MHDFSYPDIMSSDSQLAEIVGGTLGTVVVIVVVACIVIPIIVAMVKHQVNLLQY